MRIPDVIRIEGFWWIPNKAEKERIPGTLEISQPGNITLELLSETDLLSWRQVNSIWGAAQNGKLVSLLNPKRTIKVV